MKHKNMWWWIPVALGLLIEPSSAQTGNHPEWPRWCGKAYQPE
jgi:hypothetical protein